MKILVTGSNGQVGWELCRGLALLGDIVSAGRGRCAQQNLDLSDAAMIGSVLDAIQPGIIVNAAAYTNVDEAEQNVDQAMLVNAVAPEILANWASRHGVLLVHYSTDYVFDGSGSRPWREADDKAPLNAYGESKLIGDKAITASGCRHLIFRTSWVYSLRGRNFFRTMTRLAGERDVLRVVDDQISTPTTAELIADVTAYAILALNSGRGETGTYHLTSDGYASWFDFASLIVDRLLREDQSECIGKLVVEPVSSSEFPTPARRPKNSRLDTSAIREAFGLSLPHWQVGVERAVSEYCERIRVE